MSHIIDMTGQRFGKLTVIEMGTQNPSLHTAVWVCLCDCGNKKVTTRRSLLNGDCKSCGCIKKGRPVQLQYIKNDPDWKKKKKSQKKTTCPYNEGCVCLKKDCKRCGWNPRVAKARMERMGYGN